MLLSLLPSSSMHDPKIYIVILNYLQWQDTRDCLGSVLGSSYRNFSVIIIDNDSQNNSLDHLREWTQHSTAGNNYRSYSSEMINSFDKLPELPPVTFIQNDKNTGFAAGNNIILRLLGGEDAYIWLLNPDMVIEENTMAELVSFATKESSNPVIGAAVRSYTGNRELLFYGGGSIHFISGTVRLIKEPGKAGRLDYISGACLFTHAANFKKFGLLPEDYFLYWEETDWCFRAKQEGVSLLVCPSAICYDKISTVIGKGFLANYYYSRNGLLFISRFRKKNIPVALFSMTIRWFKRIITGQWSRARGVYKGTIDFLKKRFHAAQ